MLSPRDIDIIRREIENGLSMERLSDTLKVTFQGFNRVSTGSSIARHMDNAPLNPWNTNVGYTITGIAKEVPCLYVPQVMTNNLVQEGYHPDSELEVLIQARDLLQADISVDDIRNVYSYISVSFPHDFDLRGRTDNSITQLWDIVSVRPTAIANQLIFVIIGLRLREQDITKVGDKDKV